MAGMVISPKQGVVPVGGTTEIKVRHSCKVILLIKRCRRLSTEHNERARRIFIVILVHVSGIDSIDVFSRWNLLQI